MNYGAAKKIRLPREAIGCSSEETRRKDLASKPYTVATQLSEQASLNYSKYQNYKIVIRLPTFLDHLKDLVKKLR